MKRFLVCVAALVGCGDNSNECDPGTTMNVDGVCVGNPTTCSDGTILVDGHCEIDPNACQDGTVLVGNACVDPGHVTADVEEGAEPNGLGLIEFSTDPAGEIKLKPVGQHFVVHGKIVPFQDDDGDGQTDPDIDTYFVQVSAPTMLSISADGLHGLAAGFLSVANVASTDPLSDWTRFGVNLTGDTSQRQLYLPTAGVYLVAIGDSRSLLLSGGAAGADMGAPAFEYYISIDQVTATPTMLTVTNGVATSTGTRQPGEVKLFSVAMGEGINSASLESTAAQIQSSVVITSTRGTATTFRGIGDGDDTTPAEASAIGIRTGDSSIVVADSVLDYANQPTPYDLTVKVGTAGALSTSGGDVSQPGNETDLSTFYYDVAPDGLLVGMNVAFDVPVAGVVVDENFFVFSNFTFDPDFGFFFADTFQSYKGLLRHATPGRYYFLVFDPAFDPTAPTDITATSTYAAVSPATIVKGTPLTNQAINAFESNPFTYMPGIATDPWQTFTGSGSGTGTITAAFFAPDAVGRLDTLTNTCGAFCDDRPPTFFTQTYTAAGQTRGRILLDNANVMQFLVTVNTATVTGTPTFSLDYKPQTNVNNMGLVAVGTPATDNDNPFDATNTIQRFLVRTAVSNNLTLNVSPDDAQLNTRFQRVNVDETANGPVIDNGGNGAPDQTIVTQGAAGWTAFTVDQQGNQTATFDVTVTATAPVNYMTAAGTTAFSDACTGGTAITLDDLDEGQSAAINTPAGFDYFGFAAGQVKLFANGIAALDTSVACGTVGTSCFFGNADMPNAAAPNAIIAPYWDDLVITGACQKTSGTKLILQWTGTLFSPTSQVISMQVILDGANDTIEFVYGPTHTATGSSGTIGIENQIGSAAKKLSFNTAGAAPNTLFTPM